MLEAVGLDGVNDGVGDGEDAGPPGGAIAILDARPPQRKRNRRRLETGFTLQVALPDDAGVVMQRDVVPRRIAKQAVAECAPVPAASNSSP